jgi:hypothetical protein
MRIRACAGRSICGSAKSRDQGKLGSSASLRWLHDGHRTWLTSYSVLCRSCHNSHHGEYAQPQPKGKWLRPARMEVIGEKLQTIQMIIVLPWFAGSFSTITDCRVFFVLIWHYRTRTITKTSVILDWSAKQSRSTSPLSKSNLRNMLIPSMHECGIYVAW